MLAGDLAPVLCLPFSSGLEVLSCGSVPTCVLFLTATRDSGDTRTSSFPQMDAGLPLAPPQREQSPDEHPSTCPFGPWDNVPGLGLLGHRAHARVLCRTASPVDSRGRTATQASSLMDHRQEAGTVGGCGFKNAVTRSRQSWAFNSGQTRPPMADTRGPHPELGRTGNIAGCCVSRMFFYLEQP